MRKLIYSMTVSLDGYTAAPDGAIDWSVPDEELHRFHNQRVAEVGVHLWGRRLYETMLYWETADQDPNASDVVLEFARIYKRQPKLVFSTTLASVVGNATLATGDPEPVVKRLKQEPGEDLAVGGAGLASTLMKHDLIDDYRLFISPVILGGGTRFFPDLDQRLDLELVETRTFASRVIYARYRRI
jgi:dihydrofolate reductase